MAAAVRTIVPTCRVLRVMSPCYRALHAGDGTNLAG